MGIKLAVAGIVKEINDTGLSDEEYEQSEAQDGMVELKWKSILIQQTSRPCCLFVLTSSQLSILASQLRRHCHDRFGIISHPKGGATQQRRSSWNLDHPAI